MGSSLHKSTHQADYDSNTKSCTKPSLRRRLLKTCKMSKNGRCSPAHGHTVCTGGYCSRWGWCGTSSLHKSTRQTNYDSNTSSCTKPVTIKTCKMSKNGRCGPSHGHTVCTGGYCSRWGWCGWSSLHKSTHQADYDSNTKSCTKPSLRRRLLK